MIERRRGERPAQPNAILLAHRKGRHLMPHPTLSLFRFQHR